MYEQGIPTLKADGIVSDEEFEAKLRHSTYYLNYHY